MGEPGSISRGATVPVGPHDALIVVDVQNDFCPQGALAVPHGDEVVPIVNRLIPIFHQVVLTQDWHAPDHTSFASQHKDRIPYETVEMPYGEQVLWPDHCVQGTPGAEFHPDLDTSPVQLIVRKGHHREIDSYSTFFENDRTTTTGLAGYLRDRQVARIFLCGLATDFCVFYSAIDARRLGFAVVVLEDACRGIGLDGSVERAWKEMEKEGVLRSAADRVGEPEHLRKRPR